jgi:hypothetical protein
MPTTRITVSRIPTPQTMIAAETTAPKQIHPITRLGLGQIHRLNGPDIHIQVAGT